MRDYRELARALTIVENELEGAEELLLAAEKSNTPLIGLTGPPGAGKSTLLNALIALFIAQGKRVGVLAVDPTSPFSQGAILGDRIRMSPHFNHPNVFIRSVASRGFMGGISAKTMQMADIIKAAGFDLVFIETVGVGQSEVEIARLADLTLVVLVPQGDDIQTIKSGLMEIADAFVLNKSDQEGAESFGQHLTDLLNFRKQKVPVFKTTATKNEGTEALADYITQYPFSSNSEKSLLLAEKAWTLIQEKRMANLDKTKLRQEIAEALLKNDFNLYQFVKSKV